MIATMISEERQKELVAQLNGAFGMPVVGDVDLLDYADLWNLHELVDPQQTFALIHQRWCCPTLPRHVEQALWQQAAECAPETMVTLLIPPQLENVIIGVEYVRLLQRWQRTSNPGCPSYGSARGAANLFDIVSQRLRRQFEEENRLRAYHLFPIGLKQGTDGTMLCYYHF